MTQILKDAFHRYAQYMAAGATSLALMPGSVFAQEEAAQETLVLEEVVVTGTLIRGIKPTGSQTIGIDTEAILESGSSTANDLIGTLPQATNLFNSLTSLNPEAVSRITVTRPNLRNLPGINTSSGAATLVMVDGHRVVGMGVQQSAVDPDLVPPAIIERVEMITDGGSSLYGADAVGGVINLLTVDEFDGVQIDAGYSTGDDYWSYDANITAGTNWEGGSGYVSLSYSDRDAILGKEREWTRSGIFTADGLINSDTECIDPVGTTVTYESTDFDGLIAPLTVWSERGTETVGEPCWTGALGSLVPEEDRSSVMFGISQDLFDGVALDVKGYYSERNTTWDAYPLGDTVAFGPDNLELTDGLPPGEFTTGGGVGFSYAPHALYKHRNSETEISTWGITPEVTFDLSGGWQLRTLLHYSRSDNSVVEPQTNQIALQEAVAADLLDPLDVASADDAAVAEILDWELGGESEQELFLARMIADGAVMDLPAGELSLAVGVEYQDQKAKLRQAETVIGGLGAEPYPDASRDVQAAFAEVQVPIIAGVTGIESLILSASVRYDDYSDFGSTTNPHFGLTWEPVDWISIHANVGESFNAPTLMDALTANGTLLYTPSSVGLVEKAAAAVGAVIEEGREDTVLINGAEADLDPQTADTWAAGFEILPPFADGQLLISANYYEIEFYDILGSFDPRSTTAAVAFKDRYIWNPTQEELEAAAALTFNGAEEIVGRSAADVATIIDGRLTNTDEARLKGVDFAINYYHETSFGSMSYGIGGNHQTEYKIARAGGDFIDQLDSGTPATRLTAAVGWSRGNLNTKLTLKYTDEFDVNDAAVVDGKTLQDSVDSFSVFDLFVGYDFEGSGFTDGLSARLNVGNIFDEEPPAYRRNEQAPFAGWTLGRVFTFGVTKRFQ